MPLLFLNDIADAMSLEHHPNPNSYLVTINFANKLTNRLHQAALSGELTCYDLFGIYKPENHEKPIHIRTTKEAVNKYFEATESLYRYGDIEPKAEAVEDVAIFDHAGTEPKLLNQFDNEFKFSGLLNMPSSIDYWFEVIDVMTKDYYLQLNNSMPTKAQAWVRLCENPPTGYGITASQDNLSLTMIGIVKPFTKIAFGRRWNKYTTKSSPI